MILNLPFIRDQRKELKAGVGGFQKNLQDWGGEAKQPQALKGSRQTSTVSPALATTCSLAYDVGVGGPQKSSALCWHSARVFPLGLGCGFIWSLSKI